MKIIHDYQKCIGCGSCTVVCPKYWKMNDEGKSQLIGSKLNSRGSYELEVEEVGCNKEAANLCPAQCIRIKK